jgi:N-acyl-D-aspartate/D-glutamate deacylase
MVGHCALRRYVLGDDFKRHSTPEELAAIVALLHRSLQEGGLGLSISRSSTEVDGNGERRQCHSASYHKYHIL